MSLASLLARFGQSSLDTWWSALANRPYPLQKSLDVAALDALCPAAKDEILKRAQAALHRNVNVLGSGTIKLSTPVEWSKDYASGYSWEKGYFRDIDYNNSERPSDVKMAWEVSRMQWAIPLGQAWVLTGNDGFAAELRKLLEEWIDGNPYGQTVNWSCTMEVAMRIFTWTWFFHMCSAAPSWADTRFRERFLKTLWLHGIFTERYIERSDVNGNHFTADAAALVVLGLFFGKNGERLANFGWRELERELPLQVTPDGVDYEASCAYHRLVTELFLLPACYREACGLDVSDTYKECLRRMALFTAAYTKPTGLCPLWGDADDARVLPFGHQNINDHRYLVGLVGLYCNDRNLLHMSGGPLLEAIYWFGERAKGLSDRVFPSSQLFRDAGVVILRKGGNHCFIDCGPVGLAGRGGHGHNDCLSLELVLNGTPLITDCGSYVYTKNYRERQAFRSTASHNTPQVDGEEINRWISPKHLWNLHNDAIPELLEFLANEHTAFFKGSHRAYDRLGDAVKIIRQCTLDFDNVCFTLSDSFSAKHAHTVTIPLHLAPGVTCTQAAPQRFLLQPKADLLQANADYFLDWNSDVPCDCEIIPARVSQSYGTYRKTVKLQWSFHTEKANIQWTLGAINNSHASQT
ncbi:MAG: hypothetical protein A2Y14_02550 [Verrucomicrobia bacterium GWF2_51_19]|nr:MAG: hypothetical protein A2Y14_02550 [Verrucomicrobia bacterium GWF2_51_19]